MTRGRSINDKLLLVLDLDETLIHGTYTPLARASDFVISGIHIYERPFLERFLRDCAEWYHLAVWSSASDDYVNFIANKILPAGLSWQFVWGRSRATLPRRVDPETGLSTFYDHHTEYEKRLSKISKKGWPLERILIVDDTPKKSAKNYGNAIHPVPYEGDPNDSELPLLARYLETLKEVRNVRKIEKRLWRSTIT